MDVRRSGSDLRLLGFVAIAWLSIGAYVLIRVGTDSDIKVALIAAGWSIGLLAVLRNARLRVWTKGPALLVRNGWFRRKYLPEHVHSFVAKSYAGGHWIVEMNTAQAGRISMHATDRRDLDHVDSMVESLQTWLSSAMSSHSRDLVVR
jgi:hypothetical protein